jgi:hypothetical protein
MSDHWIRLIPRDPHFIPTRSDAESASVYFRQIAPECEEVMFSTGDCIEFRDCGENLESIRCPFCHSALEQDWWSDRMSDAFDGQRFELGPIQLPCCGKSASLNDLSYHFDQGFSKFSLEAMNPNIGQLGPNQILALGKLLGTECRVIYQHI